MKNYYECNQSVKQRFALKKVKGVLVSVLIGFTVCGSVLPTVASANDLGNMVNSNTVEKVKSVDETEINKDTDLAKVDKTKEIKTDTEKEVNVVQEVATESDTSTKCNKYCEVGKWLLGDELGTILGTFTDEDFRLYINNAIEFYKLYENDDKGRLLGTLFLTPTRSHVVYKLFVGDDDYINEIMRIKNDNVETKYFTNDNLRLMIGDGNLVENGHLAHDDMHSMGVNEIRGFIKWEKSQILSENPVEWSNALKDISYLETEDKDLYDRLVNVVDDAMKKDKGTIPGPLRGDIGGFAPNLPTTMVNKSAMSNHAMGEYVKNDLQNKVNKYSNSQKEEMKLFVKESNEAMKLWEGFNNGDFSDDEYQQFASYDKVILHLIEGETSHSDFNGYVYTSKQSKIIQQMIKLLTQEMPYEQVNHDNVKLKDKAELDKHIGDKITDEEVASLIENLPKDAKVEIKKGDTTKVHTDGKDNLTTVTIKFTDGESKVIEIPTIVKNKVPWVSIIDHSNTKVARGGMIKRDLGREVDVDEVSRYIENLPKDAKVEIIKQADDIAGYPPQDNPTIVKVTFNDKVAKVIKIPTQVNTPREHWYMNVNIVEGPVPNLLSGMRENDKQRILDEMNNKAYISYNSQKQHLYDEELEYITQKLIEATKHNKKYLYERMGSKDIEIQINYITDMFDLYRVDWEVIHSPKNGGMLKPHVEGECYRNHCVVDGLSGGLTPNKNGKYRVEVRYSYPNAVSFRELTKTFELGENGSGVVSAEPTDKIVITPNDKLTDEMIKKSLTKLDDKVTLKYDKTVTPSKINTNTGEPEERLLEVELSDGFNYKIVKIPYYVIDHSDTKLKDNATITVYKDDKITEDTIKDLIDNIPKDSKLNIKYDTSKVIDGKDNNTVVKVTFKDGLSKVFNIPTTVKEKVPWTDIIDHSNVKLKDYATIFKCVGDYIFKDDVTKWIENLPKDAKVEYDSADTSNVHEDGNSNPTTARVIFKDGMVKTFKIPTIVRERGIYEIWASILGDATKDMDIDDSTLRQEVKNKLYIGRLQGSEIAISNDDITRIINEIISRAKQHDEGGYLNIHNEDGSFTLKLHYREDTLSVKSASWRVGDTLKNPTPKVDLDYPSDYVIDNVQYVSDIVPGKDTVDVKVDYHIPGVIGGDNLSKTFTTKLILEDDNSGVKTAEPTDKIIIDSKDKLTDEVVKGSLTELDDRVTLKYDNTVTPSKINTKDGKMEERMLKVELTDGYNNKTVNIPYYVVDNRLVDVKVKVNVGDVGNTLTKEIIENVKNSISSDNDTRIVSVDGDTVTLRTKLRYDKDSINVKGNLNDSQKFDVAVPVKAYTIQDIKDGKFNPIEVVNTEVSFDTLHKDIPQTTPITVHKGDKITDEMIKNAIKDDGYTFTVDKQADTSKVYTDKDNNEMVVKIKYNDDKVEKTVKIKVIVKDKTSWIDIIDHSDVKLIDGSSLIKHKGDTITDKEVTDLIENIPNDAKVEITKADTSTVHKDGEKNPTVVKIVFKDGMIKTIKIPTVVKDKTPWVDIIDHSDVKLKDNAIITVHKDDKITEDMVKNLINNLPKDSKLDIKYDTSKPTKNTTVVTVTFKDGMIKTFNIPTTVKDKTPWVDIIDHSDVKLKDNATITVHKGDTITEDMVKKLIENLPKDAKVDIKYDTSKVVDGKDNPTTVKVTFKDGTIKTFNIPTTVKDKTPWVDIIDHSDVRLTDGGSLTKHKGDTITDKEVTDLIENIPNNAKVEITKADTSKVVVDGKDNPTIVKITFKDGMIKTIKIPTTVKDRIPWTDIIDHSDVKLKDGSSIIVHKNDTISKDTVIALIDNLPKDAKVDIKYDTSKVVDGKDNDTVVKITFKDGMTKVIKIPTTVKDKTPWVDIIDHSSVKLIDGGSLIKYKGDTITDKEVTDLIENIPNNAKVEITKADTSKVVVDGKDNPTTVKVTFKDGMTKVVKIPTTVKDKVPWTDIIDHSNVKLKDNATITVHKGDKITEDTIKDLIDNLPKDSKLDIKYDTSKVVDGKDNPTTVKVTFKDGSSKTFNIPTTVKDKTPWIDIIDHSNVKLKDGVEIVVHKGDIITKDNVVDLIDNLPKDSKLNIKYDTSKVVVNGKDNPTTVKVTFKDGMTKVIKIPTVVKDKTPWIDIIDHSNVKLKDNATITVYKNDKITEDTIKDLIDNLPKDSKLDIKYDTSKVVDGKYNNTVVKITFKDGMTKTFNIPTTVKDRVPWTDIIDHSDVKIKDNSVIKKVVGDKVTKEDVIDLIDNLPTDSKVDVVKYNTDKPNKEDTVIKVTFKDGSSKILKIPTIVKDKDNLPPTIEQPTINNTNNTVSQQPTINKPNKDNPIDTGDTTDVLPYGVALGSGLGILALLKRKKKAE